MWSSTTWKPARRALLAPSTKASRTLAIPSSVRASGTG
jgi:hypothetical protein